MPSSKRPLSEISYNSDPECLNFRLKVRRACILVEGAVLVGCVFISCYTRSGLEDDIGQSRHLVHLYDLPSEGGSMLIGSYVIGVLYTGIGLAVVNDQFFEPSLRVICKELGLSDDVASATFYAAGSSAPALIINFIGSFTGSSVGFSTVVGANVCDLLCVIGFGGLLAVHTPLREFRIDWKPFARDMTFYIISLVLMQWFLLDSYITVWEALLMVVVYGLYVIFMCYNQFLLSKMCSGGDGLDKSEKGSCMAEGESQPDTEYMDSSYGSMVDVEVAASKADSPYQARIPAEPQGAYNGLMDLGTEQENQTLTRSMPSADPSMMLSARDKSLERFRFPSHWYDKVWFLLELPYRVIMHITIPDCTRPRFKRWYWISFFMSIMWVTLLVHHCLDFTDKLATLLGINMTIMGLIPLSLVATVPTFLLAMWGAREGSGDYLVMQPLGSNVWNNLICLGLPWFVFLLVHYPQPIYVETTVGTIIEGFSALHLTNLIVILYFYRSHWKLNASGGFIFLFSYLVFMIYVSIWWIPVSIFDGKIMF